VVVERGLGGCERLGARRVGHPEYAPSKTHLLIEVEAVLLAERRALVDRGLVAVGGRLCVWLEEEEGGEESVREAKTAFVLTDG
jgi:hypothetical protein